MVIWHFGFSTGQTNKKENVSHWALDSDSSIDSSILANGNLVQDSALRPPHTVYTPTSFVYHTGRMFLHNHKQWYLL